MAITIDDVAHLPELEFEDTRKIGTPYEVGMIAPLRVNPDLVQFEPEGPVFGFYKDTKSGMNYLVHSSSLQPHGGFPEVSRFDQIHQYKSVRKYQE